MKSWERARAWRCVLTLWRKSKQSFKYRDWKWQRIAHEVFAFEWAEREHSSFHIATCCRPLRFSEMPIRFCSFSFLVSFTIYVSGGMARASVCVSEKERKISTINNKRDVIFDGHAPGAFMTCIWFPGCVN